MTNKKVYITTENVDKYFKRTDNRDSGRRLLSILDEEVTEKQFFDILMGPYIFSYDICDIISMTPNKANETNK